VDVKSILHFYPDMKQINVNCSPTVSVNFTKEGKHFLAIKVHTIILHILLIDFHFIKSKSSTLFLRYDHLNFMLETRQRSVARAYSRGLNFECPREAGKQHFVLSFGFRCTKASSTRLCTKKLEISTFNFRVLASETAPLCVGRIKQTVSTITQRIQDHYIQFSQKTLNECFSLV
jgi:hypothetical protein